MAEKFKDVLVKSIRKFYSGELPQRAIEASEKEFIYTPEYFDEIDAEDEAAKEKGTKNGKS